MYLNHHTKIIVTIGPASTSKDVLKKLFLAGVNICRLNFSHSSYAEHEQVIQHIIELNKELHTNVAILADLQGPKLRIGEVEKDGILLQDGHTIEMVSTPCIGTAQRVYMSYTDFPKDVKVGEFILIDDGKLKLEVVETNRTDKVVARVIHGGLLTSKKGVNLPNTQISQPSLTEKDLADANFALDFNVDYIALSFVRAAEDLAPLHALIKARGKSVRVIAKIEKPEALENLDAIIDVSNGIMVARGDLGVEVPFDRVPMIQKEIVEKCIQKSKPVIIATQMLESMVSNFRPTRAEANDVANAVFDGADAVMLSAETSVGKYPVESVRAMNQIAAWTEAHGFKYNKETLPIAGSDKFLPDSICLSVCRLASQSKAKAIIVFTFSGYTALRIASHRPEANVFVFTRNKTLVRKMSLIWGVRAFHAEEAKTIDDAVEFSITTLKSKGYIKDGDVVAHVGSTPFEDEGKTNLIKFSKV